MEASPQIRIGTAGWSYKDWEGVFYPPGMQRRKGNIRWNIWRNALIWLKNSSFYGHIKPELAKVWARRGVRGESKFHVHRQTASFIHPFSSGGDGPTSAASIRQNDEDEMLAREGLEALAATGKFGALLIQFPDFVQEYSLQSRVRRSAAATVHRVSASGRSETLELGQSRTIRIRSRRIMLRSAISTSR